MGLRVKNYGCMAVILTSFVTFYRNFVVNCVPLKVGTVHLLRLHPHSMLLKKKRDWEVDVLPNTPGM